MEPIIILLWFLLVVALPLFLIVAAFVGYRSSDSPFVIVAGSILGIIFHILLVSISFFPIFLIVYVGAHTEPRGEALSWLQRSIVFGIEILYGLLALSFCSILSGRKRPWPLRVTDF